MLRNRMFYSFAASKVWKRYMNNSREFHKYNPKMRIKYVQPSSVFAFSLASVFSYFSAPKPIVEIQFKANLSDVYSGPAFRCTKCQIVFGPIEFGTKKNFDVKGPKIAQTIEVQDGKLSSLFCISATFPLNKTCDLTISSEYSDGCVTVPLIISYDGYNYKHEINLKQSFKNDFCFVGEVSFLEIECAVEYTHKNKDLVVTIRAPLFGDFNIDDAKKTAEELQRNIKCPVCGFPMEMCICDYLPILTRVAKVLKIAKDILYFYFVIKDAKQLYDSYSLPAVEEIRCKKVMAKKAFEEVSRVKIPSQESVKEVLEIVKDQIYG
uniref:Uncharacterized protein n=1 Tax=Panagrolaimus sp. PS1159 TaxID=55785 RepID=A0AC35GX30_9BILA